MVFASSLIPTVRLAGTRAWHRADPARLTGVLVFAILAVLWSLVGWLALRHPALATAAVVPAGAVTLGVGALGTMLWRAQRRAADDRQALDAARATAGAARRAKADFLANASHELRTPLNAVIGYADLLATGIAGPLTERQSGYVATIGRSGRHLLDMITELLNLANLEAGDVALDETTAEPRRLVEDCATLVADRITAGGLSLVVRCPDDMPAIRIDAPRLTQVLLNLLSNAAKFTAPGGRIVLTGGRTPAGGVTFAVADTGRGMSAGEIERALEPFGHAGNSPERSRVDSHGNGQAGAGLGLPVARRLTELHGGTLHIDSAKDRGTTVTLALPPARSLRPAVAAR